MDYLTKIQAELETYIEPEKSEFLPKFFNAVPGGYGEGDQFLGIRVPNQRKVARKYYKKISLSTVEQLLQSEYHEHRLTALIILVYKFEKAKSEQDRAEIVDLYLKNLDYVNNWDLVDSSADKILGAYLFDKERKLLYELADSNDLWRERVAIIATFYFIRQGQFTDTLALARKLLNHHHDLIHKAVGWMLREVGKRDFATEYQFLRQHYQSMPRTMLRYAIEKFELELRQQFLKGLVE